jgi:ATP-binding cassette subfamily B protein
MHFIPQKDQMDCGPACLAMIARHYGKSYSLNYLRDHSFISREGVSLSGISEAAKSIGIESSSYSISLDELNQHQSFPSIIHWNQNHFVVLYAIRKSLFRGKKIYKIADPSHGLLSLSEDRFKKSWISTDNKEGIAMYLFPTDRFFSAKGHDEKELSISFLYKYLVPHRSKIVLLFLLLLVGTLITLIFPILTQKLIDDGVEPKNLEIITYILLGQLAFFLGNIVLSILRNWILLAVGTQINIQIISDFFKKLLLLPVKFFDTRMMGDFNQRIQDHERIEQFLTSQGITTLFSILVFSVFFGVLWFYDFRILVVYVTLTFLSVIWSLIWMKKRKSLDYFRFQQQSQNQQSNFEILNGVTELKINQYETLKLRQWEEIQHKLYDINMRILKNDQIQVAGFDFLNQLKNILVTFLAASFVVSGKMTLGGLLSVSYIIGQMNSPVAQLIAFFRSLQEAKLSLSRLNEVQDHPNEEQANLKPLDLNISNYNGTEAKKGIRLNNISFQYEGPKSPFVLKDIDIFIPEGKITAIVGSSGSGKTTLMKLLLRFYDPTAGEILYNDDNILSLSPKSIRENCGVVMQDGYIFSDTIKRNIATGDEHIDTQKLHNSARIANIESFIQSNPLEYETKIGASGNGISGGQKQRILIARAVYKNPHYIFFDEATSALDADNEKIIHNNLQSFFKDKTVVIIAHRLSTVKNADQIIVLKDGQVSELGHHNYLVEKKGEYFSLVKNQLELGA